MELFFIKFGVFPHNIYIIICDIICNKSALFVFYRQINERSPSRLGDDHFGAEFMKLIPQILRLENYFRVIFHLLLRLEAL